MKRSITPFVVTGVACLLTAACATRMSSLDQGLAYYRDGRFDQALLAFDDAVKARPDQAAAWNDRAVARVRLGQLVGAIGDYTKAIELAPTDPELYFNRGNAYVALGNDAYAVQDYTTAIRLAPGYAKAYFNRGTARLRSGDRAGADADWRYAIAIEPDPWTKAAMVRSAGLGSPAVKAPVSSIPGTLERGASATPPLPPVPVASAAAPPARPSAPTPPSSVPTGPSSVPSASPALGEATRPAADQATALAARGIAREIDGDRAGAIADLRAAMAMEQDPARRATIEDLLHWLESGR